MSAARKIFPPYHASSLIKGEQRVMATLIVVDGQWLAGGELVFTLMVVC
jgi:hypothetical protein